MFTGIIRAIGEVVEFKKQEGLLQYAVSFPYEKLECGASVSIDGVCQTVVNIENGRVWFDAIDETLKRTTLDTLHVGRKVNIERAAKFGDEIGGHLLSGHIYGTAKLSNIESNIYTFTLPREWMKYLFSKGYIAIDGISLTLVDVEEGKFTVHLIPETLQRTTLGTKRLGDRVNIEFDALTQAAVETVEAILKREKNRSH
ncbi:MAG: riboflavin synthase subunit alpha [Chlamydiales bacterium]|nr:riboflavin synthase subunit alpha [Chlamydiales bacterium]